MKHSFLTQSFGHWHSYVIETNIYIKTLSNGNISALLVFCAVNPPITSEFPSQRPVTQSYKCFLWSTPEQTVEYTIETSVIWDAIALDTTSPQCVSYFIGSFLNRPLFSDQKVTPIIYYVIRHPVKPMRFKLRISSNNISFKYFRIDQSEIHWYTFPHFMVSSRTKDRPCTENVPFQCSFSWYVSSLCLKYFTKQKIGWQN